MPAEYSVAVGVKTRHRRFSGVPRPVEECLVRSDMSTSATKGGWNLSGRFETGFSAVQEGIVERTIPAHSPVFCPRLAFPPERARRDDTIPYW